MKIMKLAFMGMGGSCALGGAGGTSPAMTATFYPLTVGCGVRSITPV